MKGRIRVGLLVILAGFLFVALLCFGRVRENSQPKLVSAPQIQARDVPTAVPAPQADVELIELPAQVSDPLPEELDTLLLTPLELQRGVLPWEERINSILSTTRLSDSLKARILLGGLRGLPEEGLQKASQEAIDRLSDRDYAIVAGILIDPRTHGMVQSVLFADLLERPDGITLPTLLAIARNTDHPLATSARDNLELLLGKRFENDWAKWEVEISRALRR